MNYTPLLARSFKHYYAPLLIHHFQKLEHGIRSVNHLLQTNPIPDMIQLYQPNKTNTHSNIHYTSSLPRHPFSSFKHPTSDEIRHSNCFIRDTTPSQRVSYFLINIGVAIASHLKIITTSSSSMSLIYQSIRDLASSRTTTIPKVCCNIPEMY